jgi:hypothetical protein
MITTMYKSPSMCNARVPVKGNASHDASRFSLFAFTLLFRSLEVSLHSLF